MDEAAVNSQGGTLEEGEIPVLHRGVKRPATATVATIRKQLYNPSSVAQSPMPVRGQPTAILTTSRNESGEGVTYRLLQIAGSTDGNQGQQHGIAQAVNARIVASAAGQGELVTSVGQQIVLNSQSGLAITTTGGQNAPARLTLQGGALTVASTPASNQPIQLQSVDNGGGQYYVVLPSGTELMQASSSTPTRIVTAPRMQQAAFIPLSRLEAVPVQASNLGHVQSSATATTHPGRPIEFDSPQALIAGNKDVKRRVSHNEVEKRRRDKINSWITRLARVVPSSSHDYGGGKPQFTFQSKGHVLERTLDYIQELREAGENLADALRHYEEMARCLKDENKQLRNLLRRAGIQAPEPLVLDMPDASEIIGMNRVVQSSPQPAAMIQTSSASASDRDGDHASTKRGLRFKDEERIRNDDQHGSEESDAHEEHSERD